MIREGSHTSNYLNSILHYPRGQSLPFEIIKTINIFLIPFRLLISINQTEALKYLNTRFLQFATIL